MTNYQLDIELLNDLCPAFVSAIDDEPSLDQKQQTLYNITQNEGNIMKLRDDYITRVEVGNHYVDKLLDDERKYFTKKYGEEIYNYLLNKRSAFSNAKTVQNCNFHLIKDNDDSSTPLPITINNDIQYLIPNLLQDLSSEYLLYNQLNNIKNVNVLNNLKNNKSSINKNLNDLYSKSSVNQRKIEYRQEEIDNLNYINNVISLFYFFILIFYFIYLTVNNQLKLLSNWWFYIILILFPIFIYPVLFHYIKKIFNLLSFKMEFHGPKNAFLNKKFDLKFIDNHDV